MNVEPTAHGMPGAGRSWAASVAESGPRAIAVASSRPWGSTAWVLVGVAGILGVLALRSGEDLLAQLPPCAFREVFHVGCATCGFTRAAVRLAQGGLAASWMLHPLAVIVALEVVLGWTVWGASLWRRRPVIPGVWCVRALAVTAVVAVVVWLVRLVLGTVPI